MKLSQDLVVEQNHVHSYTETQVTLRLHQPPRQVTVSDNFIVMPSQFVENWTAFQFTDIPTYQDQWLALQPEVILIATSQLPSDPQAQYRISQFFNQHQIGIEFMSIGPACRTYNLLLSEARKTLLAVMF